jgi:hypothetical protein
MSSQSASVTRPIPVPITTDKSQQRRSSRFIEGTEVTGPEIFEQTPGSIDLLFTILSEMDAHEAQRKHQQHSYRGSNSSVESFNSSTAVSPTTDFAMPKEKEGKRSLHFGRMSVDGSPRDLARYNQGETEATLSKKVKGRLRAWTVGKDRDVKPYSGT